MSNLVIAFPRQEVARRLKKILTQSGYHVPAVCASGAQALERMGELESGILVCGARFADMTYAQLYEDLPEGFQMLLIAGGSAVRERQVENLVCLVMPFQVHELLETVEMMEQRQQQRKKLLRSVPRERSGEEKRIIGQAKSLLMERNGMTEEEAHRYMQKRSMENGTGLFEVAQMLLCLYDA